MGTIDDYLLWRGDLSFAERPFNDCDNVVCSCISYLDLASFVPKEGEEGSVSVHDALRSLLAEAEGNIQPYVRSMANITATTLDLLAESRRFGPLALHDLIDVFVPERAVQASALTIDVTPQESYVSFRGTDSTLVGWQEDFMLSFTVTEAQTISAGYLKRMAKRAQREGKRLYVGGHSKGGNLASYAAAMLPQDLAAEILFCWSNDGPGMDASVVSKSAWDVLGHRFLHLQPTYSIVGQLFDRPEEPRIYVKSTATGALQHDPTSWEMGPSGVIAADDLLPQCKVTNQIFADWIASVPKDQRRSFTEELFRVLGAGGATTLDEVTSTPDGIQKVLQALAGASPATKDAIMKLVASTVTNTMSLARHAASRAMESAALNAAKLAAQLPQGHLRDDSAQDGGDDGDDKSAPERGAERGTDDTEAEDGD